MFKQFLHSVQGVDIYLIFSLLVFLVFFISVGIWLFRVDKGYIKDMKNLPLGADTSEASGNVNA